MWRYPNLPSLQLHVDGRDARVRAFKASSMVARLFGLLGRRALAADEALWLTPCNSVHTLGMSYPIDVVYLDKAHRVIGIRSALAPRRLSAARRARSVLELPASAAQRLGLVPGARVTLEGA
jgi:uncharacterized membrane protein (UPF0127 family)